VQPEKLVALVRDSGRLNRPQSGPQCRARKACLNGHGDSEYARALLTLPISSSIREIILCLVVSRTLFRCIVGNVVTERSRDAFPQAFPLWVQHADPISDGIDRSKAWTFVIPTRPASFAGRSEGSWKSLACMARSWQDVNTLPCRSRNLERICFAVVRGKPLLQATIHAALQLITRRYDLNLGHTSFRRKNRWSPISW